MSRVGKKPVPIPAGVDVGIDGRTVRVKGPKGELSQDLTGTITARVENDAVVLERGSDSKSEKSKHGLYRSLVGNMVLGVSEGFEKKLVIMSTRRAVYRAQLQGKTLVLNLGYTRPVEMAVPEDLQVEVVGNDRIVVRGADKQRVGEFAAQIRSRRKPDVYRDRGIRYEDEQVRRIKIAKPGIA